LANGKIFHKTHERFYGRNVEKGDQIEVEMDMDSGTLSFYI